MGRRLLYIYVYICTCVRGCFLGPLPGHDCRVRDATDALIVRSNHGNDCATTHGHFHARPKQQQTPWVSYWEENIRTGKVCRFISAPRHANLYPWKPRSQRRVHSTPHQQRRSNRHGEIMQLPSESTPIRSFNQSVYPTLFVALVQSRG